MARVDIKPSFGQSPPSDLPLLKSPLPKRSKLSLKRNSPSPYYHETCNNRREEECSSVGKLPEFGGQELPCPMPTKSADIEMIDLTCDAQDENLSPNCSKATSTTDSKPVVSEPDTEEDTKIKVWTIGLPNCGNTCFVNSILQVLRYSPNFLESLHLLAVKYQVLKNSSDEEDDSHEVTFFRHMHTLYAIMKKKEFLMTKNVDKDYSSSLIRPMKLVINSLREVTSLFEEGEQHDAHELLITIIASYEKARETFKKQLSTSEDEASNKDATYLQNLDVKESDSQAVVTSPVDQRIKRSLLAGKRRRTKSLATDLTFIESLVLGMNGKIRHIVKCLECEKRLEREESFANLEVTIPEDFSKGESVDLRDCLSQTTMLCGENKYYCETCQQHNEAEMSSEIISAPPILLLHFSWMGRFSVMSMEKTSVKVVIPLSLETSENSEIFCCSPNENYKLYAVVLHIGPSTSGGHYVSFIRDAFQESVEPPSSEETTKSPLRQNKLIGPSKNCCVTDEIMNFRDVDCSTKWLLFDDDVVSPVVIDEDSESFPYFNFLSVTASPCMIFYHKT